MRRLSVFFIPVVFLLLQCAALQQLILRPTCTYKTMEVGELSLTEGTFIFKFQMDNPNPIGFSIRQVDYDIKLNDESFFSGVMEKGFHLRAMETSNFELPITIEYLKFFKSVQDFLKLDKIPYRLSGTVYMGSFRIPFKTSGTFKKPNLPRISLSSVKVADISLKGAEIVINVALKNPNQFPLNLDGLDYDIKLADISILSGSSTNIQQIAKNGELLLKLPVKIGFSKVGRSLTQLLKSKNLKYSIKGQLKSKTGSGIVQPFPFERAGVVTVKR